MYTCKSVNSMGEGDIQIQVLTASFFGKLSTAANTAGSPGGGGGEGVSLRGPRDGGAGLMCPGVKYHA